MKDRPILGNLAITKPLRLLKKAITKVVYSRDYYIRVPKESAE